MCPFNLNEEVIYVGAVVHQYFSNGLTPGKKYRVIECKGYLYDNMGVINDTGVSLIPNWNTFISLKENRKEKLNKISVL